MALGSDLDATSLGGVGFGERPNFSPKTVCWETKVVNLAVLDLFLGDVECMTTVSVRDLR